MSRLHNPWPERTRGGQPGPRQVEARHLRAVGAGDVAEARRLMSGLHGPALSLNEAAQVLGVLSTDLDRALWREIGRAS